MANGKPEPGEHSSTRAAIINAAMEIMRDEGYAAVSSRRIAEKAGLKSNLVHYYFKTMDELFLAVCRLAEEQYAVRQAKALASKNPLRSLWEFSADTQNGSIILELIAMANHRKAIPDEIARSSSRSRMIQAAILERALNDAGVDTAKFPPMFLSLAMTAISRLLAMDNIIGLTAGHDETRAVIEGFLQFLEEGKAD